MGVSSALKTTFREAIRWLLIRRQVSRHNVSRLQEIFEIGGLLENGLVEVDSGRLRLTRKGMLFSNEVFAEFV